MSIKNIKDSFSKISIENTYDFVNKYLTQIIYFICILLVISFFSIFVINRKNNQENDLLIKYYQANNLVKENNIDDAIKILEKIYNSDNASKNVKSISGLKLADLMLEKNEIDKAIKIYKEVNSLEDINPFIKDLSGLAALNILINQNNPKNYPAIENMIKKLNNPNNTVLSIVLEKEGIFEIQRGNKEKGLAILKNLIKSDIDENSKKRINEIIELYDTI